MVGTQRLLEDGQAALVQRLGFGVAALVAMELSQVVERYSDIGVVGSQRLLQDRDRALQQRLGLGGAVLVAIQHGDPNHSYCCIDMVLALLTASQLQRSLSEGNRFRILPGSVKLADALVIRGEVIRLRAGRTGRFPPDFRSQAVQSPTEL